MFLTFHDLFLVMYRLCLEPDPELMEPFVESNKGKEIKFWK